jgi:intraflagellar transport protein 172
VKLGNLRTNKSTIVYGNDEYVVSLCCNPEGTALCAGHIDGSIYIFSVSSTGTVTKEKITVHPRPPYCLGWGESIVAGGSDLKIIFYDRKGNALQKFDYAHDDSEKEFTSCEFNPSGQSVVVGSFNRFRTYTFSPKRKVWEEAAVVNVPNIHTVTALAWKTDGSKLIVGSLCGALDIFDACIKYVNQTIYNSNTIRRYKYKGKFEVVYTSPSQVIVKRISSGERILLNSMHGYEITKLKVYSDRYLIAYTQFTLLMGDLGSKKKQMSEVLSTQNTH